MYVYLCRKYIIEALRGTWGEDLEFQVSDSERVSKSGLRAQALILMMMIIVICIYVYICILYVYVCMIVAVLGCELSSKSLYCSDFMDQMSFSLQSSPNNGVGGLSFKGIRHRQAGAGGVMTFIHNSYIGKWNRSRVPMSRALNHDDDEEGGRETLLLTL
jgi:hypothetical protein